MLVLGQNEIIYRCVTIVMLARRTRLYQDIRTNNLVQVSNASSRSTIPPPLSNILPESMRYLHQRLQAENHLSHTRSLMAHVPDQNPRVAKRSPTLWSPGSVPQHPDAAIRAVTHENAQNFVSRATGIGRCPADTQENGGLQRQENNASRIESFELPERLLKRRLESEKQQESGSTGRGIAEAQQDTSGPGIIPPNPPCASPIPIATVLGSADGLLLSLLRC